jgi:hypothetical protein
MYPNTNNQDRAAEYDAARDARANSDDGAKGGYAMRPNIFKPPRMLTFRVCRAYMYTYALLETPASKRASRINRYRLQKFLCWKHHIEEQREQYYAAFKAIDARRAAERAAQDAQKVDTQDIDPQTIVASLVYSEAAMTTEVKRLQSYIETLEAIEASKDWAPAIGDRVRMVAGTGHTRRLIGYAKIAEITEPHDSHPYKLHADDDPSPMLWSNRAGIVKA